MGLSRVIPKQPCFECGGSMQDGGVPPLFQDGGMDEAEYISQFEIPYQGGRKNIDTTGLYEKNPFKRVARTVRNFSTKVQDKADEALNIPEGSTFADVVSDFNLRLNNDLRSESARTVDERLSGVHQHSNNPLKRAQEYVDRAGKNINEFFNIPEGSTFADVVSDLNLRLNNDLRREPNSSTTAERMKRKNKQVVFFDERKFQDGGFLPMYQNGRGGDPFAENSVMTAWDSWDKQRNRKKKTLPSIAEQNMGIKEVGDEKLEKFKNAVSSNIISYVGQEEMQGAQQDMMTAAQALQQQQFAQFGGPSMGYFGVGTNPMDDMFLSQAKQQRNKRNKAFGNLFQGAFDAVNLYADASAEAPMKAKLRVHGPRADEYKAEFDKFKTGFDQHQQEVGAGNIDWNKWETMAQNFNKNLNQPKLRYGGYPQYGYGGYPEYDEFGGAYYGQPYEQFFHGGPHPAGQATGYWPTVNANSSGASGYWPGSYSRPAADSSATSAAKLKALNDKLSQTYQESDTPYTDFLQARHMTAQPFGTGFVPNLYAAERINQPNLGPVDWNYSAQLQNQRDEAERLRKEQEAEQLRKEQKEQQRLAQEAANNQTGTQTGTQTGVQIDPDEATTTDDTVEQTADQTQQLPGTGAIGVGPGGAFFSLPEGSKYKNIKMKKNLFGPGYRKVKVSFRDDGQPSGLENAVNRLNPFSKKDAQDTDQSPSIQEHTDPNKWYNKKLAEREAMSNEEFNKLTPEQLAEYREADDAFMEAEEINKQNTLRQQSIDSQTRKLRNETDLQRQRDADAFDLEQSQVRRDLGVGREGRFLKKMGRLDDRMQGDNDKRAERAERKWDKLRANPNTPLAFQAYGGANHFYPRAQYGDIVQPADSLGYQADSAAIMDANIQQAAQNAMYQAAMNQDPMNAIMQANYNQGQEALMNQELEREYYNRNQQAMTPERRAGGNTPTLFEQGMQIAQAQMNNPFYSNMQKGGRTRGMVKFTQDFSNQPGLGWEMASSAMPGFLQGVGAIADISQLGADPFEHFRNRGVEGVATPTRLDNQGRWTQQGQLSPDQMTYAKYGGYYKEGGEVYMTPAEEAEFLRNGGEFEYID